VGTVIAAARPRSRGEAAGNSLDALGIRYGTELSSFGRDCLRGWERFLAPFREEPFDLLEIGVGSGASLRTWREWFPAAQLVGLDARRVHVDPPIVGCTIVQGDQADPATLHQVVKDRRFRVVVDDGSRRADDQILTFQTLFPWLAPGAVYICAGLPDGMADADEPHTPAAGEWFAALGRMLVTGDPVRDSGDGAASVGTAAILRRASGVFLMRGSALVTG
jgi:hypothetical protein